MYHYILFDADGTLFDYERAESEALRGSFERSGIPFQDDYLPRYREINGGFWRRFENKEITLDFLRVERFAAFFRDRGIDLDPAVFSPLYISLLGEGAFLFPGARELLQELHQTLVLAIITNGITEVQKRRIAKAGIGHFFRALIISEEIGISKPDPAYFEHALQVLGVSDRSEALIVGDSLSSDIKGGINSGIDTCWFNPAGHKSNPDIVPTHEIGSFHELRPILDGAGTRSPAKTGLS